MRKEIGNLTFEDVEYIHKHLCIQNWAPWMVVPISSILGRISVFPEGQLLAKNETGNPVGYTFINRINWNGEIQSLKSWKEIAGTPTTFKDTYEPNGNTLVLMSMNVHKDYRGQGIARGLIARVKELSKDLGVNYLIGSFRPNQYGEFKLQNPGFCDFEAYCRKKRKDGLPVDEWLRNLTRNGVEFLSVDF